MIWSDIWSDMVIYDMMRYMMRYDMMNSDLVYNVKSYVMMCDTIAKICLLDIETGYGMLTVRMQFV